MSSLNPKGRSYQFSMNTAFSLLFIGGLITTLGDVVMKHWTVTNNRLFYIIGLFIYLFGLAFLAQSYKFENIAVASLIFVIINIILLSFLSFFYFRESLSYLQIAGLFVGMVSIALLELG